MLNKKETERLEELRAKLLDKNGDYIENADFDELQELAKLEAKAEGKKVPPVVNQEEEIQPKFKPKDKAPKIIRPWLKKGYDYYGVDKDGTFILRNEDEGLFYRLNRDPNFVDALAEGLPDEYLGSLK